MAHEVIIDGDNVWKAQLEQVGHTFTVTASVGSNDGLEGLSLEIDSPRDPGQLYLSPGEAEDLVRLLADATGKVVGV